MDEKDVKVVPLKWKFPSVAESAMFAQAHEADTWAMAYGYTSANTILRFYAPSSKWVFAIQRNN